jgi:parallel beta-helix repeat protein
MTGKLRGSGDALGNYDPARRAGGSGTETAYNTIKEASAAARGGDIIVIRGGTYHEVLRPQNSGGPGIPITYKNYDHEKVTIRDTRPLSDLTPDEEAFDQRRQYGIYIYDKSYIVIEGLHITGVSGWARIVKSHHVTLRNNEFTLAQATGTTGSVKLVHSHYNRILDNLLHDGNDNLLLIHSNRNLVQGNSMMKGRHALWSIRAGSFNVIRNNYFHNEDQKIGEIYDNEHRSDPPVLYDAAKHNLVDNNVFARTASSGNKSPYAGIQFAGQRCIIRKNQFYEIVGPALDLTLYSDEARYNYENRVYNNVFHDTDFAGIRLSGSSRGTFHDNVFKNNVLSRSLFVANDTRWPWYTHELAGKPVQVMTGRLEGFVFENNNLFSRFPGEPYLVTYGMRSSSSSHAQHTLTWWQDEYPDLFQGNVQVDPLFVDEANHDFRIQETSPMIDAGTYLTGTVESGSGTSMPVEDVKYFYDGFGIAGEMGDSIQLDGQTQAARIIGIDYGSSSLKLDRSLSWIEGQGVSLAYHGSAPDLGAHEFEVEKAQIAKSN